MSEAHISGAFTVTCTAWTLV